MVTRIKEMINYYRSSLKSNKILLASTYGDGTENSIENMHTGVRV